MEITRYFRYDDRGRLIQEDRYISSTHYLTDYSYYSNDTIHTITYPDAGGTREAVTYGYNLRGLPYSVSGSVAGSLVNSAQYNNLGAITQINLQGGLTTNYGYWGYSGTYDNNGGGYYGRLWRINAGTFQNTNYTWDGTGNLVKRQDVVASDTESFSYDFLDRLSTSTTSSATNAYHQRYGYDSIGNIDYVINVLTSTTTDYSYKTGGSTRPHAVTLQSVFLLDNVCYICYHCM
jgi:hypothetical protein